VLVVWRKSAVIQDAVQVSAKEPLRLADAESHGLERFVPATSRAIAV
jgi:hypothetical protein